MIEFNEIKETFLQYSPVMQALLATLFTWIVTALGAAIVFIFSNLKRMWFDGMLGFTGGVMLAASYWSLLAPSIEMAENMGMIPWIPPMIGFACGAIFLFMLDKIIPHLHINFKKSEQEGIATNWEKTTLLILAITLHNIPEGLAVGVAFGAVAHGIEGATIGGAIALAIGIGLQNFPEGIAVSMPLRRQGLSKVKCWMYGQLSAVVEPVAGVLGAITVMSSRSILPYMLAFAAGAMVYVVVEEVIPESQKEKYTDFATLGLIFGFIIMMNLDVALG